MNTVTTPCEPFENSAINVGTDGQFRRLIERHCRQSDDNIWRSSFSQAENLPEQGYKLHLSSDLRHAVRVLGKVAPFLDREGVHYKVVRSLRDLRYLNAGIYGFSQVGKFMTIYPCSLEEARRLALLLVDMTAGYRGPRVPSDAPFRDGGLVYYRYGEIARRGRQQEESDQVLVDPEGNTHADERRPGEPVPDWVREPLGERFPKPEIQGRLLQERLLVTSAISQRGKGGVYSALDISSLPASPVILKEGRRDGESDWYGRDGRDRLEAEVEICRSLKRAGQPVPSVRRTFQIKEDFYAVVDRVQGGTLERLLGQPERKLHVHTAIAIGWQVAAFLTCLHSGGWVWRDCKPSNMVLSRKGQLTFVDFEGACSLEAPDLELWSTFAYLPPEARDGSLSKDLTQLDRYALGVTLHQLLTSRNPDIEAPLPPIGRHRRGVPEDVRYIVDQLVSTIPEARPTAGDVVSLFGRHLSK